MLRIYQTAFIAAFLVGLGMGAEGDIIAYLISRYFGLRAFGEIYGYAFSAFTLGGVLVHCLWAKALMQQVRIASGSGCSSLRH